MRILPLLAALALAGCTADGLRIAEQGSFAVGGTVVKAPGEFDFANPTRSDGRTLHGDHAAVSYQIPMDAKAIPLVFLPGYGQTSRCWDTTPDGREGWRTTFLRRGWPVYLVDQPRRGSAGRTTVAAMPAAVPDDQLWLENFRIHAGAFPEGEAAMDQFLRWMTPDCGPIDGTLVADSLAALTRKIGPAVLFTHSQGGIFGWAVPGRGGKVAAIVAIEPGAFPFPKGEMPAPIPNSRPFTPIKPVPLEAEDFAALCRVPILVLFGDGIAPRALQDRLAGRRLAGAPGAGPAVRRVRRASRRRRHARPPAGGRYPRQHAFPLRRHQQRGGRRLRRRLVARQGP